MQKRETLKYRVNGMYKLLIEKQEIINCENKKLTKNILDLSKRLISLFLSVTLAITMGLYLIPKNSKNEDDNLGVDESIVYTNNDSKIDNKDMRNKSIAYVKLLVCIEGILCLINLKFGIPFGVINEIKGTYDEVYKLYEWKKDNKYIDEMMKAYLEQAKKLINEDKGILDDEQLYRFLTKSMPLVLIKSCKF